jgi:hypothetical protein
MEYGQFHKTLSQSLLNVGAAAGQADTQLVKLVLEAAAAGEVSFKKHLLYHPDNNFLIPWVTVALVH